MTGLLLKSLKNRVTEFTLIPGRGGCFELTVDGTLIYSKLAMHEFPNEAAMLDAVIAMLKAKGSR